MIIGYMKDLDGVLKAAIALKRNPDATIVCGKDNKDIKAKLSQYHGEVVMNVNELVKDMPFNVKASLWIKFPIPGRGSCSISLGSYITYSLRSSRCVPDDMVRLLALYYPNLTVILAHKDTVSKKYYRMYRETMGELERMRAHTRLRPAGDMLYVEINPENQVEDLYMEWAARRFNDKAIVVKCHSEHYLVNARSQGYDKDIASISKDEAERLIGTVTEIDNEIWDTFYDSQSIDNRRNKKLAKKMLPAKYSYLSPEIRKERKKIEHGIQDDKLDDFF